MSGTVNALYLLHDTCFSLREGNVTTRLVLNEFDLDLSAFSSALLIIVIIIIARHGSSWSLGASSVNAIASQIVAGGRMVKAGSRIGDVRHRRILIGSIESDEGLPKKVKCQQAETGSWWTGRNTTSEVGITEVRLRTVRGN